MSALLALFLLASPTFDAFDDGSPDPSRWYVGVGTAPGKGALKIPRKGWIVSRGIPDDGPETIELRFRHKGGGLEVTFHDAREPLTSPIGPPLRVPRGRGERVLLIRRTGGALLDGRPLAWQGEMRGTFRIAALGGDILLDEVLVAPRPSAPTPAAGLERRSVHFATTPPLYRRGDELYERVSLLLWDVEVAFLHRRGEQGGFRELRAPVGGAPLLGVLIRSSDGKALASRAGSHPLAMRDWGDESRNMSAQAFRTYLAGEYRLFELMQSAQRALTARLAPAQRKGMEALVHLAVIRHAGSARAAVALAETQRATAALSALRKAAGKGVELRRMRADTLRKAAGDAARALVGEPPAEWPGFRAHPQSRFVTIQQARELVR